VESVFNAANQWICMDGAAVRQDAGAEARGFVVDLANTSRWEPVFMAPGRKQVCAPSCRDSFTQD